MQPAKKNPPDARLWVGYKVEGGAQDPTERIKCIGLDGIHITDIADKIKKPTSLGLLKKFV
jgi:hypothetical protein